MKKKHDFRSSLRGEASTRADRILYAVTILFSILFLVGGYRLATRNGPVLGQNMDGDDIQYRARITEIVSSSDIYSQYSDSIAERRTVAYAELLSGPDKGSRILVTEVQDSSSLSLQAHCAVGDKLFVQQQENEYGELQWYTVNYIRSDWLYLLGGAFVLLVLLFGGRKGVRTILSLGLTCLAIFAVLIPLIIAGYNIYWTAIVICLFTIVMTLALVSGWSVKSLAAGIGCSGGVLIAGLITILSVSQLHMTGIVDDDSLMLLFINEENPIDLRGIVFAAIIIGAVGATMDVGMDIASSLTEIYRKNPDIRALELVRSGFTIGRDIMGTMSNTLVLAYIGSGLHVTMLFMTYHNNLQQVLSIEMITSEVLQALAGSIGIVFTIPTTTFATSFLFYLARRLRRNKASAPVPEPTPAQAEVPPVPEETPQRVLRRPEEVPFFQKQNKE
jgi:uncharacterized membrane protein